MPFSCSKGQQEIAVSMAQYDSKCLDSFQLSLSVPELHLFADESMLFTPCVCVCVHKCDNLCEHASCKWPGVFWLLQTYGLNIKVGNILGG